MEKLFPAFLCIAAAALPAAALPAAWDDHSSALLSETSLPDAQGQGQGHIVDRDASSFDLAREAAKIDGRLLSLAANLGDDTGERNVAALQEALGAHLLNDQGKPPPGDMKEKPPPPKGKPPPPQKNPSPKPTPGKPPPVIVKQPPPQGKPPLGDMLKGMAMKISAELKNPPVPDPIAKAEAELPPRVVQSPVMVLIVLLLSAFDRCGSKGVLSHSGQPWPQPRDRVTATHPHPVPPCPVRRAVRARSKAGSTDRLRPERGRGLHPCCGRAVRPSAEVISAFAKS